MVCFNDNSLVFWWILNSMGFCLRTDPLKLLIAIICLFYTGPGVNADVSHGVIGDNEELS